jgi:hypothetical protein
MTAMRHNLRWLAVLFLAMTTTAAIGYFDPPVRFDHPNKNVIVKWVARGELYRYCGGDFNAVGCARPSFKPCIIFAVHYNEWSDARLLRHEIAHCNGWPANHPE